MSVHKGTEFDVKDTHPTSGHNTKYNYHDGGRGGGAGTLRGKRHMTNPYSHDCTTPLDGTSNV